MINPACGMTALHVIISLARSRQCGHNLSDRRTAMTTIYVTHPRYDEHDLPGHPEHAGRIRAVWRALDENGLSQRMNAAQASEVERDAILAVHTPAYLDLLQRVSV